jgi:hypothetical protein
MEQWGEPLAREVWMYPLQRWFHVIGGATLFSSSSMGRFNNDIALWPGLSRGR